MIAARALAFCVGFLSLSVGIVWARLLGFVNDSSSAMVLLALIGYLLGVALGAVLGGWFCRRAYSLWLVSGVMLALSIAGDLLGPWIYATYALTKWQLVVGVIVMVVTVLLKSIAFPIAHHIGAPAFAGHLGRNVSRVYIFNVLGVVLASLVAGSVLLERLTVQCSFVVVASLTFLVSIGCFWRLLRPVVLLLYAVIMTSLLIFLSTLDSNQLVVKVVGSSYSPAICISENESAKLIYYRKNFCLYLRS